MNRQRPSRLTRRFLIPAACAFFLAGNAVFSLSARADDFFAPPKISEFTGSQWGKLTFGQSSQEAVKRDWKNGRGDFRNSVELKTSDSLPYKISALFPNVQKNATLDGIVIRWRDENNGPLLADLKTALGDESTGMVMRHPSVRHENWEMAAWPQKGVFALLLGGRVAWVLLGSPGKIAAVSSHFTGEPVSITPVPDPAIGKTKEVVYGSVQAAFDLKNISLDRKDRERDDTESDLRRAGDGGSREPLRYRRDSEGKYEITVYAHSRDDKDTDGRVSAHLTGTTVYGKIDVSSDETFKVEKGKHRLEDTPFYRAIVKAERNVEEKAGQALRAQGPPTPNAVRNGQWNQIVETYRTTSAATAPPAGGLL